MEVQVEPAGLPTPPSIPLVGQKRPQELSDPSPAPAGPNPSDNSDDDSLALLLKHTVVKIVGNNRTKQAYVGLTAVVKRAVGLGGWHWLVLQSGEEIKLQRNALAILEHPRGDEPDFTEDEEEEQEEAAAGEQQPAPSTSRQPAAADDWTEDDQPRARQRRPPSRPLAALQLMEEQQVQRRASSRQTSNPRINLSKLDMAALRRYRRFYQLPDTGPATTKEQLVSAVAEHFSAQEVDEGQVIPLFLAAARRHVTGRG